MALLQADTLDLVEGVRLAAGDGVWARALVGWHLLSLDAATVATVWMWFVGRETGVAVHGGALAAMFVAVWMLYAGDRLLDARKTDGLEARHRFHGRYRVSFLVGLEMAGVALVPLVWRLDVRVLRLESGLAGLLAAWLVVVHTGGRGTRLAKEMMVGPFFAAAVFLPALAGAGWGGRLVLRAVLFAAVCTLNCLWIERWEGGAEVHWLTALGVRRLEWLTGLVVVAGIFDRSAVGAACALAAAGLFGLGQMKEQMGRTVLRAAADLALLTPVLFVLRG